MLMDVNNRGGVIPIYFFVEKTSPLSNIDGDQWQELNEAVENNFIVVYQKMNDYPYQGMREYYPVGVVKGNDKKITMFYSFSVNSVVYNNRLVFTPNNLTDPSQGAKVDSFQYQVSSN